ncbi:unannotated protein [freshwater metagenome]|uniref:Unannotated protein n=1 Tax=freshwater metagenome TaxID=449393 RepID=A0A6J6EEL5_9ZZZZ
MPFNKAAAAAGNLDAPIANESAGPAQDLTMLLTTCVAG